MKLFAENENCLFLFEILSYGPSLPSNELIESILNIIL